MNKLLILIIPLISISAMAQEKVWSIQDCMEYAVKNNLQIQQQSLLTQDAELNISDARGAFLPDLGATANNTWTSNDFGTFRTTDYFLSTTVPIFNGFQNKNSLKQAKLQQQANTYSIGAVADDVRINIANAYLQILLQQENLALLEAQYQLTKEQIALTENLVTAGTAPEGDLLDIQAIGASDLQNIIIAENDVAIAILSLKQLLNLNFESPFAVEKIDPSFDQLELLDKPINTIVSKVLGVRNEVLLAEQNIDIAEKQVDIAKGAYLPSLSGFANVGTSETDAFSQLGDNFGSTYGLRLSVPIFNRFATRNAVSRNEVNTLRNKYELDQTKLRLAQNIYQTYLDAKAGNESYEAAQTAVKAQELAYAYSENRYEVGIINSLEFSQAKLRLQNAQTQLIQAKYNFLFQLKLLELFYNS